MSLCSLRVFGRRTGRFRAEEEFRRPGFRKRRRSLAPRLILIQVSNPTLCAWNMERNDKDGSLPKTLGNYIHTRDLCKKVGDKTGNGPKRGLLNLVKDPDKRLNVRILIIVF